MYDTPPRAPEGRVAVQLRWPTPRRQADGIRPLGTDDSGRQPD
jgi:hypothetical protein